MSDGLTEKKTSYTGVLVLYIVLFAVLVAVDPIVKRVIVANVKPLGAVVVIKNFFSLYYCENTGSAFSLFADKPWGIYFLSGISLVLGIGIFVLMLLSSKQGMRLISLAFCLLSSGAIGNLVDRFMFRYVVDYLRFDFGSYTFPIFNFADICAVLGTFLLIFIIIFKSKYFEDFWNLIFKKKEKENAV